MPPRQRAKKKTGHRTVPDPLAKRVGERVQRFRAEADYSFDAFVEEVGLGRGYVSEIQRGMVVPSLTALATLATALEVTIADLVLGDSRREQVFAAMRRLEDVDQKRIAKFVEQIIASRKMQNTSVQEPRALAVAETVATPRTFGAKTDDRLPPDGERPARRSKPAK